MSLIFSFCALTILMSNCPSRSIRAISSAVPFVAPKLVPYTTRPFIFVSALSYQAIIILFSKIRTHAVLHRTVPILRRGPSGMATSGALFQNRLAKDCILIKKTPHDEFAAFIYRRCRRACFFSTHTGGGECLNFLLNVAYKLVK